MDLIDVSTRVGWPVYVVIGLLSGLMVWVLAFPDRAWRVERAFVGWQYRHGDRIELSAAGRLWARFSAVLGLVMMAVLAGMTINWSADSRVMTESRGSGGTVYRVGEATDRPGCTVRIFVCLWSDEVFPIEVARYRAADDANLLLFVDERFFPTHVVIEDGEQVAVTLYGKCAPWPSFKAAYGDARSDCRDDPLSVARGIVPVSLAEPLGGRRLIDGYRDAPVEKGT